MKKKENMAKTTIITIYVIFLSSPYIRRTVIEIIHCIPEKLITSVSFRQDTCNFGFNGKDLNAYIYLLNSHARLGTS